MFEEVTARAAPAPQAFSSAKGAAAHAPANHVACVPQVDTLHGKAQKLCVQGDVDA